VWTLHLLPKAIGILPSLRAEADAIYARLLAGIAANDVTTVKRLLASMSANI
jgi:DNA-binding MarR family transcriptional regulator